MLYFSRKSNVKPHIICACLSINFTEEMELVSATLQASYSSPARPATSQSYSNSLCFLRKSLRTPHLASKFQGNFLLFQIFLTRGSINALGDDSIPTVILTSIAKLCSLTMLVVWSSYILICRRVYGWFCYHMLG